MDLVLSYPIQRVMVRSHVLRYPARLSRCPNCLSRATTSRRVPNWSSEEANLVDTILNQSDTRLVQTDPLNRVNNRLALSLEGESVPTPNERPSHANTPRYSFTVLSDRGPTLPIARCRSGRQIPLKGDSFRRHGRSLDL